MLDEREELRAALHAPDANRGPITERLNVINRVLGDPDEVFDPLETMWEEQIAAGLEPDLDASVEQAEEWLRRRQS